ncbi:MAG: hypothetical protein V7K41_10450 [Nostoc sp.]|uniref:hypothetical protein n=1 Tax=Nostoc sp. TaxID=1180 RepID=UPI002FF739FD
MGRWTPLILMAGGLAILLGTLLGINFPMGVQTANAPSDKKSEVLPANINVNSSAGSKNDDATQGNETTQTNENRRGIVAPRPDNRSNVAQNSADDSTDNTTDGNTDSSETNTPSSDTNQGNEPIRALW